MAAILNRLLTVCLALAFLVSVTVQLVPCGMAQGDMNVRADMADGCAGATPRCTDHMPACIDHVGCLTIAGLPVSPALIAVTFDWIPPTYDLAAATLSGISIEPELSPPILSA